ncbi:unnamed protein product [Heligmosomoides polygyrus]|uniref:Uncharacterized protein n=1 Tax=Heligmosomoides polygyrus TaxID=6339 RepID=A0A3P7TR19_HELPZ|nr:unnamed protein product [Heligmosomoides polygyrus]
MPAVRSLQAVYSSDLEQDQQNAGRRMLTLDEGQQSRISERIQHDRPHTHHYEAHRSVARIQIGEDSAQSTTYTPLRSSSKCRESTSSERIQHDRPHTHHYEAHRSIARVQAAAVPYVHRPEEGIRLYRVWNCRQGPDETAFPLSIRGLRDQDLTILQRNRRQRGEKFGNGRLFPRLLSTTLENVVGTPR